MLEESDGYWRTTIIADGMTTDGHSKVTLFPIFEH